MIISPSSYPSLFFLFFFFFTFHLPMPFISIMEPCYICINVTIILPFHHQKHHHFLSPIPCYTLIFPKCPFPNPLLIPLLWSPPDLRMKCRGVSIGPSHSAAIRIASQSDDFPGIPGTPGFFLQCTLASHHTFIHSHLHPSLLLPYQHFCSTLLSAFSLLQWWPLKRDY